MLKGYFGKQEIAQLQTKQINHYDGRSRLSIVEPNKQMLGLDRIIIVNKAPSFQKFTLDNKLIDVDYTRMQIEEFKLNPQELNKIIDDCSKLKQLYEPQTPDKQQTKPNYFFNVEPKKIDSIIIEPQQQRKVEEPFQNRKNVESRLEDDDTELYDVFFKVKKIDDSITIDHVKFYVDAFSTKDPFLISEYHKQKQ